MIIKPVLDAFRVINVSAVSFLSGCTVFCMSIVSLYKNLKNGSRKLDFKISTYLAIGAVIGGLAGKYSFQLLKTYANNENYVGFVQAIALIIITGGTFVYTLFRNRIKVHESKSVIWAIIVGIMLGIMSSFLGIGGGPINLVVLAFIFGMETKTAALASLYIIMFSQASSLIQTVLTKTIPQVPVTVLLVMAAGAFFGGNIGSKINQKINSDTVDKLFMFLMAVIIMINVWNAYSFYLNI